MTVAKPSAARPAVKDCPATAPEAAAVPLLDREGIPWVAGLVAVAAVLPVLATPLPPLLSVPFLAASAFGCTWMGLWVLDKGRRRLEEEEQARQSLLAELESAKTGLAASEERCHKAEERRRADAVRLCEVQAELEAVGSSEHRTRLLAAGDEATTLAAERSWYTGQAAAAYAAMEEHRAKAEEIVSTELPALHGKVEGLKAALEEARSQTQQAESSRELFGKSAAQLNREVEHLRQHSSDQKEELQRLEEKLQSLQKEAEALRQKRLAESSAVLKVLDRSADMEGRQVRVVLREKKATVESNEALRAELDEWTIKRDGLEKDLEKIEAERLAAEGELASVRSKIQTLEDQARTRDLAEKEAARQREERERAQSTVEELQTKLQEARLAAKKAEVESTKLQKEAETRQAAAEALVPKALEVRSELMQKLKQTAQAHDAELHAAQAAHGALQESYEKVVMLTKRLAGSEDEKMKLKLELEALGAQKAENDAVEEENNSSSSASAAAAVSVEQTETAPADSSYKLAEQTVENKLSACAPTELTGIAAEEPKDMVSLLPSASTTQAEMAVETDSGKLEASASASAEGAQMSAEEDRSKLEASAEQAEATAEEESRIF
eukprot:gnl/TRDRNA2_/TRDRNA2_136098_c0_seq3.p1 gnl/TRDRNA2_/TRDRNA2_136098_c0~~gnl/TRDRNA2_/TRDRNA2_136098_c0_seq3.p1  ORF type:complete len:614 (+),score=199.43 gnl/TRDRNA2_/TRDRNA2_136098_c0_seq3:114-1955(+)